VVEGGKADARIYAALAYGYAALGHSPYPEGMYPASKKAAQAAMELDDSIPELHLAIGMHYLYYEWDVANAEKSLLRALELNPSLTGAYYHYAWLMELLQRSDLSLPAGDKTIELDPLSPFMRANLAAQYRNDNQYAQALKLVEETLELEPGFGWALWTKSQILLEMGDIDGAIEASTGIADHPMFFYRRAVILASADREEEVHEILAGVEKTPRNVLALVGIYAALGDADAVFHWLKVAKESKMVWYPWFITWFPALDELRDDPRMRELAKELGLTEPLNRSLGWLSA
jgi:tetratricopeptide (TPR) repeat protein